MSFTSRSPAQAYTKIGIETGVVDATPHKLILMLFEGALLSIALAENAMRQNETGVKGKYISQALDIIICGLKASLRFPPDPEFAARLSALYDYMSVRLLHANLHNDQAALNEVASLLSTIKSAWEEIAPVAPSSYQDR